VRFRGNAIVAIALVSLLFLPQSAPAADSLLVVLGDSTAGAGSRINASFKGAPGFGADIYLQPCTSSVKTDCIQSVYYQNKKSSEWIALTLDEKIVFPSVGVPRFGSNGIDVTETLTAFAADENRNFPAGGMTPVYKDSKAAIDDGVRYMVEARALGSPDAAGKAIWTNLLFNIRPVKIVDYSVLNQFGFPTLQSLPSFENATAFKVEIRSKATKNLFSGWFYGRIFQPEIKSTVVSAEESVVQIIGSPIVTHLAQGSITFSQYEAIQTSNSSAIPKVNPAASVQFFGATYGFANSSGAMNAWRLLGSYMNARAVRSNSVFSFNSIKNSNLLTDYYPQGCQASASTDGVVTTNATMYNPAPPSYEASDGSLNFEVGSPHLDAAGEVIQGFYSLVVSAKLAKCIWGSDLTNSKATVSIVNESGTAQVTTSVLQLINDFYYFHISGFTYSTKKISIRVAPVATVPTPSPSASPIPTNQSKPTVKNITCVKGKVRKYISGTKPVCPPGYKIK
jgi:hypothetical protein